MKNTILLATLLATSPLHASLVAHYDFDTVLDTAGVFTSDEVTTSGTEFATAGSRGVFNQDCRRLGIGSLVVEDLGGGETAGSDGAISSDTFDWGAAGFNSDVRTVAFWVKASSTQTDPNPTMISLGAGTGGGNRFDIRLTGANLRLEVQSGGFTTGSALADDTWHHVAVVVPIAASTLADITYYVDGALIGAMSGTRAIATGTGPLRMGDSYQDTGRDFTGSLDDVRLYDEALDDAAILALYNDGVANIPAILCFSGAPLLIDAGQSAELAWEVDPSATSATIDNGVGDILTGDPDGIGTATVSPAVTTTYTLTVDRGTITQQQITINVDPSLGDPAISADRELIANGESVDLDISFDINADTAVLTAPGGPIDLLVIDAADAIPGDGMVVVTESPTATFTYQVDLTKAGDPSTNASVEVRAFTFTEPADNALSTLIKADAPLFYYRFEEPAAAGYLFDSSGNDIHTDDIVGTLDQGSGPGGMQLAGEFQNNAGILVPGARDMEQSVTLCAVVNSRDVQRVGLSGEQAFFSMTDGTGTGRTIFYFGGGTLSSFLTGATASGTQILPDNTSCLVHMVYDAETGDGTDTPETRFYINGVFDAAVPAGTAGANVGNWILGARKNRAGQFLDGWLDEAAAFESVLTDAQITAHGTAFFAAADPLLGFEADTLMVGSGSPVTLTWKTSDQATAVTLNGSPVDGDANGGFYSTTVNPTTTTTYTLEVTGPGGPFVRVIEVTITGPATITSISYDAGFVSIEALGTPNATYTIRASSTLDDGFPAAAGSLTLDATGFGSANFLGLGPAEFYLLEP